MAEQADPGHSQEASATRRAEVDDEEINLLDLMVVLAKHKKLVIGLPFLVAILSAVYALQLPNIYTATTRILPPQQSQSTASAMIAQLGSLAGLVGGAAGFKNPNDVYVAMLKSRTVADNLIKRFDLMNRYEARLHSQARKRLEGGTRVTTGKDGLIRIDFDDEDPSHAAAVANAYVDEFYELTKVLAVTEASQRRLFFEQQFVQAKENLSKAEMLARQALQQGGIVKVDDQGRAMVETTARLRAQIAVKEVQLGAMRAFATERNPELQRTQQELDAMKRELTKIEGDSDTRVATPGRSRQGIENLRLLRDVKYFETLYELLARQYELAKIDEAKESTVIQVMDKAVVPDDRSKPVRRSIVLVATFGALIAAILWALILEAMAKACSDPRQAEKLGAFKRYMKLR